jgi:hypothetical protein
MEDTIYINHFMMKSLILYYYYHPELASGERMVSVTY